MNDIEAGSRAPLVSVVLPVYEPTDLLTDALRSVLGQDLGAERMQIAIVDDASPTADIDALTRNVAPAGRIEIVRTTENLGLAGNWNRCLSIARGEIVHILHQDDRVNEGFYDRMLPAFSRSGRIGMAFCRHSYVDADGRVTRRSHKEKWRAGILKNWLESIAERQRIQCASAVVRRSVYQELGGYCADLCYALDWEMWVRIAARYEVWYEPRVLAQYRRHSNSETRRLRDDGRINEDTIRTIGVFARHLPDDVREDLTSRAYSAFARRALKEFESMSGADDRAAILMNPLDVAIAHMRTQPKMAERYRAQRDQIAMRWQRAKR